MTRCAGKPSISAIKAWPCDSPAVLNVSMGRVYKGYVILDLLDTIGVMPFTPKAAIKEVQDISFLAAKAIGGAFRRPYYIRDLLIQMDSIGVGSVSVVILTGFFTGAVLALQTSKTLSAFGAKGLTGQL